jgi:hypothetical protein
MIPAGAAVRAGAEQRGRVTFQRALTHQRAAPHVLERFGRHRRVAYRVRDLGMAEVVLEAPRVHSLGGQGIPR